MNPKHIVIPAERYLLGQQVHRARNEQHVRDYVAPSYVLEEYRWTPAAPLTSSQIGNCRLPSSSTAFSFTTLVQPLDLLPQDNNGRLEVETAFWAVQIPRA
jgi:hypothetical protein